MLANVKNGYDVFCQWNHVGINVGGSYGARIEYLFNFYKQEAPMKPADLSIDIMPVLLDVETQVSALANEVALFAFDLMKVKLPYSAP